MEMFTMNEAAEFLERELPHKSKQDWWGYLRWNPKKKQDGILIVSHVVNGEQLYTSNGLKAFVALFGQRALNRSKANKAVA